MNGTPEERSAYTDGLRKLADLLDADDELELPYDGSMSPLSVIPIGAEVERAQLVAWARALRKHGQIGRKVRENKDGSSNFDLTGTIGGLRIKVIASREAICKRVVTGTEDREVEEEVTPAVTRTVTKPVEIVEWVCEPILAADAPDPAEDGEPA